MNTIIKGRIAGAVELTVTDNGTVANFRIAENKAYIDRKSGAKRRVTTWYSVKAWNDVAESIQTNCRKGDLVKFKVNVQPNSYLSEKKQKVINELIYTANRYKVVGRARANQN